MGYEGGERRRDMGSGAGIKGGRVWRVSVRGNLEGWYVLQEGRGGHGGRRGEEKGVSQMQIVSYGELPRRF